jgi:hypothetical protein
MARWCWLAIVFACPAAAQHRLLACGSFTKEYVVGAKLPPSGLFERTARGWEHQGHRVPFLFGVESDPTRPGGYLLAAGNGLLRTLGPGGAWGLLTASDVTEVRDLVVDRRGPGAIYFGHSAGIRVSRDGGDTWAELGGGLRRKYTEALRVDPRTPGVLLAGGEEGIFRSEDDGKTWRLAGASGFQILRLEASPHDACFWLAGTQQGGLFSSRDCGRSFESGGRWGVGFNIYEISFDATRAGRVAVASWGPGVMVSEDGGKTWQGRNAGLPSTEVTAVAFDPDHPGRLYAAVREQAVYVSDDAGATWRKDGLEGSFIARMRFLAEAGR